MTQAKAWSWETGTDITRLNYDAQTEFTAVTDRAMIADEPRFRTTLADVTSVAVHEPGVAGAALLAATFGLLRHRRRGRGQ